MQEQMDNQSLHFLSPVSLAFIGDAAFELYVRTKVVNSTLVKIDDLHRATVKHVQATAQATAARVVLPLLDETEAGVFRRAKNVKPLRVPKSARLADYRYSTGIEAVMGYLYLSGNRERLHWLCQELWQAIAQEDRGLEE
jgi:ribonuclease-3 family protein